MATREERLDRLEASLRSVPASQIASGEEFARRERLRFARAFGASAETFRTVVRLRFYGSGVEGHDLRGVVAGEVLSRFGDAVKAAGASFTSAPPDALDLYLSPNVSPGSTVIELFGAPRTDDAATFDTDDIVDSPVDAALGQLFVVLDGIDESHPSTEQSVDGALGKHLFGLVRELLKGDVDLDIGWERPSGSSRATSLPRSKARHLRDLLDRETTKTERREGRGELASISTDGRIAIKLTDTNKSVPLTTEGFSQDELRDLWAHQVDAAWTETTVSHPQRDTRAVTNALVSIRLASQGQLDT